MKSTSRFALLGGVSAAAAAFFVPASANAQATTCSQNGTAITCVDGTATVLTGTTTAGNTVVAGPGLVTVDTTGPATTTYTATGPISTTGARAVSLTSTGGALSFTPAGTGAAVNIATTGANANGVTLNTAGQAATVTVGNITTSGANSIGVRSTAGTDLTLRTGNVTTAGANATAIDTQNQTGNIAITANNISTIGRGIRSVSLGGTNTIVVGNLVTGDRAIFASGNTVSVTTGAVTTSTNGGTTAGGNGVNAQSQTGNVSVVTGAVNVANGVGIFAGSFNATGSTSISGCPSVSTTGDDATAIQSFTQGTGSMTINCGALSTTGGNANGVFADANGGNVAVTITSATTTGLGSYGLTANTTGAGTVTTNAGVITTTGNGATGLFSRGGTGAIDAGYGNITTSGVGVGNNTATAVELASTGTINLRGSGSTLRTNGAGVTAALITGAGVTGNLGNVTTTGAGSQGAIITSTAPVNLTIGTVSTTGTGVTVNAGASAIALTTGAVTTTGANADGIDATTTGAITLNTGAVRTSGAGSRGIVALGGGAVSVTSAGATTTGTNASGIIATSTAGAVNVALTGSTNSASLSGVFAQGATTTALSLASGGTLNGALNGATLASGTGTTVTNAGTITGTNAALAITGGAATINNSGTITGRVMTTANADTINNSGTFNGNGGSDFGAGNDTFNNSGTYNAGGSNTFGDGTDTFNNSGTLRVLPNATTAGTVTFVALEAFNNSGLVDLRNGRAGDTLILPGTYTGTGAAALGLDATLGTATGTADQLRIGGAATGSTVVTINSLNTTPAVLSTAAGTVLVQAGAGSSANAFTTSAVTRDQGLIQYNIVYNPTTFSYALVATPGVGVFRTSLIAQGARNLWLQSGDAWSGHMRELRDNVAANGPGGAGGRLWGQIIGQVDTRTSNRSFAFNGVTTQANLGTQQDYFGGQLGLDFGGPAGESAFAFGVTGGYLNSTQNFANSADRIKYDAVNGGLYASYSGGIFFVNVLGKYDYYWGRNRSFTGRFTQKVDGAVYGGKGEVGFKLGQAVWIEPSVSVSYTHSDSDDFTTANGRFNFDDADGVRGKGGARAGFTLDNGPSKVTLYAGGNYVHEFKDGDRVSFVSGGQTVTIGNRRGRDYGEGTLGVNVGSNEGKVSGFFEGRYANGGDFEGYGGRAGMRFRF